MAKKSEKPTVALPDTDTLNDLLEYFPQTGVLVWEQRPRCLFASERIYRSWNAKHAGRAAFTMLGQNGYLYGSIWGKRYLAHRVIFKIMAGRDPIGVDHVDGNPTNNRWANLREADQSENCKNSARPITNKSGTVGVHWYASRSKWIALIKLNGRSRHLGYFADKADAIAARKAAEVSLGFHPNHGRADHG